MTELKMRSVKLAELTSDPQNVRTHDGKNLQAIARSLDAFGQRKPIVCARANDGSLVVIAGNGTLEAARALGWDEIVISEVPREWDADKARAYAIADNRTAELADWNKVELASAMLDLEAVGWDAATLGFATDDDADLPEFNDVAPGEIGERYEVVIECANELEQGELLTRLVGEGLKVRALVL